MTMALDLAAPSMLLAMPQVNDPFFCRSVVLLAAHTEEGSFGFVVNRPTDLLVSEVLEDLEIPWNGPADQAAFMGGPVNPQVGTVLFPSSAVFGRDESVGELLPGVAMIQDRDSLARLAVAPPVGFRLILGYSGWSAGQLVAEISRHDWLLAPVDAALVFEEKPELTWDRALSCVGIDPSALPNWTEEQHLAN